MDIDILAALGPNEPAQTGRRCVVGKFLDTIPDDADGKAALVATLEAADRNQPAWRPLDQLDKVLLRLGRPTSIKSIADHRSGIRCRCYQ